MPVFKFFGYSISYTVLISPCLFCAYQFVLLNPCTFSPFSPFPLPTGNPPNGLHIYDSACVLLICLVCFLDSVVDSCEFSAILMLIVLIFFSNKSPFNISYNKDLVMMNFFSFTLSGKHFICPSTLNESFAG